MLSVLTYARIDTFLTLSLLRLEYRHYIQRVERNYSNNRFEALYSSQKVEKEDNPYAEEVGEEEYSEGSGNLNARLYFRGFIEEHNREEEWFQTVQEITKRLLRILYSDKTFYQKAVYADWTENGRNEEEFLEHLLQSIMEQSPHLKQEGLDMTQPWNLAKVEFADQHVRNAFCTMLRGSNGQRVHAVKESDPALADGWIPSLFDYIGMRKKTQTSVYLAHQELLQAFFQDEELVKDLLVLRQELYRDRKKIDPTVAEKKLKDLTFGKIFTLHDQELLEWRVSGTRPTKI
jgi:hypothetical protein